MREKTKAHKSLPFGVVLWDRLRKATKSKAVSSIKRPSNSPAALKWQRELASWYSPKIEETNYDDDLDFEFTSEGLITFSSGSYMESNSSSNNSHTLAALSEQVSHMFMSPPLANVSSLSYYNSVNGSNISSPLVGSSSPMGSPATRRRSGSQYEDREDASTPSSPLVLPTHDEVARSLTDLQKHMLKIVRENKGRASLDTIVEGIQKSRDTLRKRDGSQYAIDCRRAVAATLAKTSFNSSLFVKDDSDVWKFGPLARVLNLDLIVVGDINEPPSKRRRGGSGSSDNSDESESSNISSPSLSSRYLRRVPGRKGERTLRLYAPGKRQIDEMNNEGDFSDNEDGHDIDQDDEDEEALDDHGGESEDSPKGTPRMNRKRGRPSKQKDDSNEEIQGSPILSLSREGLPDSDGNELTQLQLMMIEAINKNGGSAPLGIVYKYVSKRWGNLRRRDDSLQNVDCKTAVKSSLSVDAAAIAPIFECDSHREGCWKVTKLGMELMRAAKEKKERKQQQQQAQKASAQTEEQPKLTDMQGMLMKIILGFGGAASFEQIFTEVTTKWKTKWDTDCKRALLASLSHNPPGNFKKNKDGLWTIAPKALPLVSCLE